MTQRALVDTVYIIGFVFLGLALFIVLSKAYRETRDRWRRVRRSAIEPRVLTYVHGNEPSILPMLGGGVSRSDRLVMEETLLSHIQRVRGIERERLRHALQELGYVDRYLSQLGGLRWWSRAQAAEKLGLSGSPRAAERLVAALQDDSPEVRIRAAKALGAVGGTAVIRLLIRALGEPNRWSTIRIADILADMGGEVADELVSQFPRLNLHAKLAALDILGRLRPPHVAPWLRERVQDGEPDVRARACHAMGSIGDPDGGTVLRSALHDTEWPVRAMAAKALGRIRRLDAAPDLCDQMRDREWWVRSNSAQALRQMGGGGIDALVFMLEDRDTFARHQAALMLEESGVLDRAVDLMARGDGPQREGAETLVRRFVRAGRTERLGELAATHGDPDVRQELRKLLEEGLPAREAVS